MSGTSNVEHALACVGDLDAASNGKTRPTVEGRGKKRHFYKPLPTRFRRDGFDYRQIFREGDFAIYRQTRKGNEHSAAFEAVRIRRHEGFQIGGRFVEPAEIYPRSEDWGVNGFTFTDKEAAFAKLRGIADSPHSHQR